MDRLAHVLAVALLVLVSACGPADTDPGPGGVTVGEAKALDEAAEMLEQRRLPADALPAPASSSSSGPSATPSSETPAQ